MRRTPILLCVMLVSPWVHGCAAHPPPPALGVQSPAEPTSAAAPATVAAPVPAPTALASTPDSHQSDAWKAQRTYPPLVFTSYAYLQCSISSTEAGMQAMTTVSGQGFSFTSAMKPIGKSTLELEGKGMRYKFDAFPAAAFPAKFSGLGDGTIETMKAEVEVAVTRFRQPGGAGTAISFNAGDIAADAAYVEFTGLWVRKADGKRFPFRVLFGQVHDGGGKVVPATPEPRTNIATKMVAIGTRPRPATVTTSLFEEEADMADENERSKAPSDSRK